MEIERRWLVDRKKAIVMAGIFKANPKDLWQAYISEPGNKNAVRIRSETPEDPTKPTEYWLTAKTGDGVVRQETNIPLEPHTFLALKGVANRMGMASLQKKRYELKSTAVTVYLDMFEGPLYPLCISEVEFKTEEEAMAFVAPSWFDKEITYTKGYSNMSLAWKGLPKDGR